jgi:hypothetical protein
MMKLIFTGLAFLVFLCSCQPAPTTTVTETISTSQPSATWPATHSAGSQDMLTLEACGFSIEYPATLSPDGQGYLVMFLSDTDPQASVFIQLRRRDPSEANASLETLALNLQLRYFPEMSSLAFEPIPMADSFGNPLEGLQRDIVKADIHTRLVVLVRPNTLLADKLPADVIYELVAQTPEPEWVTWKPVLDAMIRSLKPRDCGGV